MKCVETFKTSEAAQVRRRLLRDSGIDARVVVDPLESMAPALSDLHDVSLMVPVKDWPQALGILRSAVKKAS